MKIIKNINNNYALAVDGNGNQVVVYGKGIGFGPVPREIEDITMIDKSFYDVAESSIAMIGVIPEVFIKIAGEVIKFARMNIENPIGSNIVFTLADHMQFCVQRFQKNMNLKLPIVNDVEQLFEKEMEVGKYAVKLMYKEFGILLPKIEAVYIALHIANGEEQYQGKSDLSNESLINGITDIVEDNYNIIIKRDNFNYSRFVSHMHYLIKRSKTNHLIFTDNNSLYEDLKVSYPRANQCVEHIADFLENKLDVKLTGEEKLYLILHVNRLCTREDSAQ